jgi:hypothetical protein
MLVDPSNRLPSELANSFFFFVTHLALCPLLEAEGPQVPLVLERLPPIR